ncbi:hypothetical protein FRC05_003794 [Tulasnella sp. 425]|nr:hypothetical protein FRC05_003794 [Tulasnella sp. 425]
MPKATRRENEEIDERSEGGKAVLKAELWDIDAAQASLDARTARVRARHGPISLKRGTSPIYVPGSVVGKMFDLTSDD